ncbi:CoxG family protein [Telmatospirillum sp. J64-1]|uniref:CoxG family protein n=1 Tax=Telmatospirillum sp. J64-1 TaxID=2502183 RepID=UPI00115F75D8|nr:carbon monoxide dehydrogenase subunit G [Telmatospirillum sp. J64-1]
MDINGEYRIPAPRAEVWKALNDPEVLRSCIPGCQDLEKVSDTEYAAKVNAKIGAVSAAFTGKVTLSDLDPPNGYTLSGEGQGGVAGFAKGDARVTLIEEGPSSTRLTYSARTEVGGKLATVGNRLVQGVAAKTADQFFACFVEKVTGVTPSQAQDAAPAMPTQAASVTPIAPQPARAAASSPPRGRERASVRALGREWRTPSATTTIVAFWLLFYIGLLLMMFLG